MSGPRPGLPPSGRRPKRLDLTNTYSPEVEPPFPSLEFAERWIEEGIRKGRYQECPFSRQDCHEIENKLAITIPENRWAELNAVTARYEFRHGHYVVAPDNDEIREACSELISAIESLWSLYKKHWEKDAVGEFLEKNTCVDSHLGNLKQHGLPELTRYLYRTCQSEYQLSDAGWDRWVCDLADICDPHLRIKASGAYYRSKAGIIVPSKFARLIEQLQTRLPEWLREHDKSLSATNSRKKRLIGAPKFKNGPKDRRAVTLSEAVQRALDLRRITHVSE
jgi:hypothetical protein